MKESHVKVLTKNDTGETGAHQGGIAVPKSNTSLINFFPKLDHLDFNPEDWIHCEDPDGEVWKMRYVYYNGKTFTPRKSTRNEYRITHMTKFFSKWGAKADDSLTFTETDIDNHYRILINKKEEPCTHSARTNPKTVVLRGWARVF